VLYSLAHVILAEYIIKVRSLDNVWFTESFFASVVSGVDQRADNASEKLLQGINQLSMVAFLKSDE
jgi:hypothetical protein